MRGRDTEWQVESEGQPFRRGGVERLGSLWRLSRPLSLSAGGMTDYKEWRESALCSKPLPTVINFDTDMPR
jgi:hypothetical protein